MIAMRLSDASIPLQAELHGGDVPFVGVSTDTRTIRAGQLFVALRGPNFDAHEFVGAAADAGAVAAVVESEPKAAIPFLRVSDTRAAMGTLASAWRQEFSLPLVAVTGSNGKTTVKEMVAAILAQCGTVLSTKGNLNNDVGVPLTLFNLGAEHRFAVIEMGANHPGEITRLCEIAKPTIAVITLCAPAHLEGFGSIEGVARAKGEIVTGLPADGVAVLNAEDPYLDLWRKLAGNRRVITFGVSASADFNARLHGAGAPERNRFTLVAPSGEVEIELALLGRHNVMNALAAAACAYAAGADLNAIRAGLAVMHAVKGRLVTKMGVHGARLIDDTYNANPASLRAAIDVLVKYPGQHWLVLGDMGELGTDAQALHHEAGAEAKALGVQRLFAIGSLSRATVAAFGNGGEHFTDMDALVSRLRDELAHHSAERVTVLVKGSRAMQLERVVEAIVEPV
ncbi:MAG: UDP-N-acetylmuramoyl-tripeptide--D-alanyl-D-alanine ligase [Gammaproteobacteria bacterium]